jgi:Spy/CpxP family protein refolding chaperone
MEIVNITSDKREMGLALHDAETALGVGRRALRELVIADPIDQVAIEAQREAILEARLARNSLRIQLEEASIRDSRYRGPNGWTH